MVAAERSGRRRLAALVLLAALAVPLPATGAPASARDQAEARAAVDEMVEKVLAVLRDDSATNGEKVERIQDIAYAGFDFRVITRLVLARNYRRMSPQQRSDFEVEFKRHLSSTYGHNLERYSNETVEVTDTRAEKNGDVTVRSRVLGRAEPILLDYRLRSRDGGWYVIDVIIEGVSLLSNFRSQTQEIIAAEGPDGLIQKLREKNDNAQES